MKHTEQDQPIFVNADRQDDTSLEDIAFVEDYYNKQAQDYGWSEDLGPDYPFGTNTSFEGWDGVRDGKEEA